MSCQASVETFSRVTGFMRPVQTWNKGKVAEFHERKKYALNHMEVANATNPKDNRVSTYRRGI